MNARRHTLEETVRLGKEIYEQRIRASVEPGNKGKVIAIEVDGGEYEIAENSLIAFDRLRERVPDAEVYFGRIGYAALHRLGYAYSAEKS